MARHLPFLNGLRAFEAASRRGSFTAAAAELHVTQTAVSQQVRLLEERLGFALFRRRATAGAHRSGSGFPARTDRGVRRDCKAPRRSSRDAARFGAHRGRRTCLRYALVDSTPDTLQSRPPRSEVRIASGALCLLCEMIGLARYVAAPANGSLYCRGVIPDDLGACLRTGHRRNIAPLLRSPKTTLIVVSHLREQWVWWCEAVGLTTPIHRRRGGVRKLGDGNASRPRRRRVAIVRFRTSAMPWRRAS